MNWRMFRYWRYIEPKISLSDCFVETCAIQLYDEMTSHANIMAAMMFSLSLRAGIVP
jgi:hypothetical protein